MPALRCLVSQLSAVAERTGLVNLISRERGGPSQMMLLREPRNVVSDITVRSRIGSIAGFVTWANRCLKYEYSSRGLEDKTASGVSSPIEPTGSLPSASIGANILPTSSTV